MDGRSIGMPTQDARDGMSVLSNSRLPFLAVILLATAMSGTSQDAPVLPQPPEESSEESSEDDDLSFLSMEISDLRRVKVTDPVVFSVSKAAEKSSDAPSTVYVISAEDIHRRGYSTLTDVLRDVPGLETIENYFSEIGTLVPVRGVVGNNKIVVLVNGMRINPPGGEPMPMRGISVRLAQQVEIVYGPGSTLYGQDANSAIINITTKTQDGREVVGTYGSDEYREVYAGNTSVLGGPKDDPIKLSTMFYYTDSDLSDFSETNPDWWAGFSPLPVGASAVPERRDLNMNVFARLENKHNSVQMWWRDSERSSAEGGYSPVLYFVDEAIWSDRQLAIEARNRTEFSSCATLQSRASYYRYEIDPSSRYVFPAGGSLFLDDFKYGIGSATQIEELLTVDLGKRWQLFAGFEATFSDVVPKATIPGGADPDQSIVPQGGEFVYYTVAGDPTSAVTVPRATNLVYENYGFFLQTKCEYSDELTLVGGVRVDTNTRYDTTPVSPRFTAIYKRPDMPLVFKYIYANAFLGPAPYFAFNVFDNGSAMNTSNPGLQPETTQSHELNLTWRGDQLQMTASTYFNSHDNLVQVGDLALPVNIVQNTVWMDAAGTDPRVLTQTANSGSSEVFGVDLFAKYNTERLDWWASYSYVDFRSTVGGVTSGLPQISRNNFRAGMSVNLTDHFVVTPSLVIRSTPQNVSTTNTLERELHDPAEMNLFMLYRPSSQVELFGTFRNLTDHRYALKGVLGPTPQEPFRFQGGVRIKY